MEKSIKIPKVKICGITSIEEAEFLNDVRADYAGFVFYPKSRRNVSIKEAEAIANRLSDEILKVAVTVRPSASLVRELEQMGFDILQVHGELFLEVLESTEILVWRAVNISDKVRLDTFFQEESKAKREKIFGYVADGAGYGSGISFDWKKLSGEVKRYVSGKQLILAGGLTSENVRQGISYFAPDVVDVSSGVEENGKKSKTKIETFIRKVRNNEQ